MPEIDVRLRESVRQRANGFCEYCRIPERLTLAEHEIDHVIALKHGGQTVAENLALSCTICNRYKGSDIASIDPGTGQLTPLFHPRLDDWDDHFTILHGELQALTAKGRVTIKLLQLNRPTRIKERQLLQR
jgi:hypothetical protein